MLKQLCAIILRHVHLYKLMVKLPSLHAMSLSGFKVSAEWFVVRKLSGCEVNVPPDNFFGERFRD